MNDKLNPYLNTEGQVELSNSIVAFLDVLGFKELVRDAKKDGKSQQLFAKFQDALKEANFSLTDHFADDLYNLSSNSSEIKAKHKFRVFTDCILIGCPIGDSFHYGTLIKGLDAFWTVFRTLYLIQSQLVNRGFFVRGAITVGELYMDERTIYGIGLIDAYEAESKQAKYPRIILTKSAEAMFVEIDKDFQLNKYNNYLKQYLYRDSDGLLFLNYLESINISDAPFLNELDMHKKVIENKLQKYYDKPDILEKYVWAANYHNLFCNFDSNEEYRIDLVRYQMQSV
ncbi:hypothetical protein Q9L42_012265 [Methylomarinum sp. Ch1-1]|uniref:Guanylate cyclase domain-containing protein n=1 Tax=Methylomarinum roseum TaxID=3067653 RepID=A0AAU7NQA6_9GAMM|nr:hypothetical protein [Methylomarinum sp. Ch1-1]MDP4520922.1 hypothetical protein [Methylomarinum sp. Ch1-1]